jgi:hypothetical protein
MASGERCFDFISVRRFLYVNLERLEHPAFLRMKRHSDHQKS